MRQAIEAAIKVWQEALIANAGTTVDGKLTVRLTAGDTALISFALEAALGMALKEERDDGAKEAVA